MQININNENEINSIKDAEKNLAILSRRKMTTKIKVMRYLITQIK